ncbi:MAG TPA: hypothetical protein VGD60_06960 [Candidatus Acidoferrales bacterium]
MSVLVLLAAVIHSPVVDAQTATSNAPPINAPTGKASTKADTITYENVPYGVSFRYPKNFRVRTGTQNLEVYWWLAGEDDGYRAQPDRVSLVTVDMPSDAYPGTGFGGAFINVSVNESLDRNACFALLPPTDKPVAETVINGVHYVWTSDGGVLNRGTENSEDDYVAYENGICYEVTLGTYDMFSNAADNAPVLLPLDHGDIRRRLNAVLWSLKIRPSSANS